ncbi:hypothetical protein [cf. Phormidesmis sp. LEGE 11477]|uniref:hypothetical protein n=1 Tax=cf. Phormidesmis sp. LEGE 11477 TaxID=1828680 RepID=UPI00187EE122|nr:hypothetical protein [cf. Phormidesmis sp. LEGE 11477]MBE9064205.1 hypothetical protein [cf. Phormidesmis sp. LEGE 11477]
MAPSIQRSQLHRSQLQKLRLYLHLVPVFGVMLSLWSLYGKSTLAVEEPEGATEKMTEEAFDAASVRSVSRLSVILGLSCVGAIACLNIGAHAQTSQINHLRFLLTSSFVGSGYFLLSLTLMFRIAKDQSVRLPGLSQLSRRLP